MVRKNKRRKTMIELHLNTRERLKKKKLSKFESYDEIINRLLNLEVANG